MSIRYRGTVCFERKRKFSRLSELDFFCFNERRNDDHEKTSDISSMMYKSILIILSMTKEREREKIIVELRTCVDYDFDFVVIVDGILLEDNDQDPMMDTYFDKHETMMMMAGVMLKEKKVVEVIVALNMDLHMFDNKLDRYKQPHDEDNMVDRNLVVVNDSSMIHEHFV